MSPTGEKGKFERVERGRDDGGANFYEKQKLLGQGRREDP